MVNKHQLKRLNTKRVHKKENINEGNHKTRYYEKNTKVILLYLSNGR